MKTRGKIYYNEHDRQKAAWLRQLIEEGAIASGVVDERPIQAVQPDDIRGFVQCHFFAGLGAWSYALRSAGWPDERPIWTGSCPGGPFSRAGKQAGFADPRHLWPEWLRIIRECRPDLIFGEQSDAADAWIDLVSSDLEDNGYAFGSPDIPAAGFGGAHIRQRFYWVADSDNAEWWSERAPWHDGEWPKTGRVQGDGDAGERGGAGGLADAHGGLTGNGHLQSGRKFGQFAQDCGAPVRLGYAITPRLSDAQLGIVRRPGWLGQGRAVEQPSGAPGSGVDWLLCRDSRWRPVEPGSCPLVDEAPARMGRLRGYGDAIDAEAATNFIAAYLDALQPAQVSA